MREVNLEEYQYLGVKHYIECPDVPPICRFCKESSETVIHLSSGFPVLAKSKYRVRHNILGKLIHCMLLEKYGIHTGNKWYNNISNVVTERDDGTIYKLL